MTAFAELFLLTNDLGIARRFYEEVLDCEILEETDDAVTYDVGPTPIKLQQDYDTGTFQQFNLPIPPTRGRGSGAVVVLRPEENLDQLAQRARDLSEDYVLAPPRSVPWVEDQMMILRDPDGYVLELQGSA